MERNLLKVPFGGGLTSLLFEKRSRGFKSEYETGQKSSSTWRHSVMLVLPNNEISLPLEMSSFLMQTFTIVWEFQ